MALKNWMNNDCILTALVERSGSLQSQISKPNVSVDSKGLYPVIIHANPLVGVSNGDVECQIVVKSGVGAPCEIEFCEGGFGDGEFDIFRRENEPENEGRHYEMKAGMYTRTRTRTSGSKIRWSSWSSIVKK